MPQERLYSTESDRTKYVENLVIVLHQMKRRYLTQKYMNFPNPRFCVFAEYVSSNFLDRVAYY